MPDQPMKHKQRLQFNDCATLRVVAYLIAALTTLSCLRAAAAGPLLFSCSADNDLFRVASENGMEVRRFDTPGAAVAAAAEGDGVLLLADGYPGEDHRPRRRTV